jgi:hypothetical protein
MIDKNLTLNSIFALRRYHITLSGYKHIWDPVVDGQPACEESWVGEDGKRSGSSICYLNFMALTNLQTAYTTKSLMLNSNFKGYTSGIIQTPRHTLGISCPHIQT